MSGHENPGKRRSRSKRRTPDPGGGRGGFRFSSRTSWERRPNPLSRALEERRSANLPVLDLTGSNPTDAGLTPPADDILRSLADASILNYRPDPHGLESARSAIINYYLSKGVSIDPSRLFLTSSTSEAYALLFMLLCNAGDAVLTPRPSYPLFDYLAGTHDVTLHPYDLRYDQGWEIDIDSIARSITPSAKAVALINPHNPTGMFLKREEHRHLTALARRHRLALIVDEVFIDYPFAGDPRRYGTTAADSEALTFTLNGISKSFGLPQLKLGWIAVGGNARVASAAVERLEIICDTLLSVNTPAQVALPRLMTACITTRNSIADRVSSNYRFLVDTAAGGSACSVLHSEGGWYGIIRAPRIQTDEQWAIALLRDRGIHVFPGYFFDFEEEACLVVSLLTKGDLFRRGVCELLELASGSVAPES